MTIDEIITEAKRAIRGEANRLNIGVQDASYLLTLAFQLGIVNASGVVEPLVQRLDHWAREVAASDQSSEPDSALA